MPLLLTLILGAFFLVGVYVIKFAKDKEKIEYMSLAIALGALTFIALFDLVPELIEEYKGKDIICGIIFTVIGFLILLVLDQFIPEHETKGSGENKVHISYMSLVAIALHNIAEGMTVYNILSKSMSSGLSLVVGIGLHNIPMGMLIYSTIRTQKKTTKYIVLGISVFSTFFGGLIMSLIREFVTETSINTLVCIALGMVLYIIIFELIYPVIHGDKKQGVIGFIIGALFVILSIFFE